MVIRKQGLITIAIESNDSRCCYKGCPAIASKMCLLYNKKLEEADCDNVFRNKDCIKEFGG